MKPEIKKLWVDALRSGVYPQAADALKTASGFCCLGVLCDLHSKATGTEWESQLESGFCSRYMEEGGLLPAAVIEWAGLEQQIDWCGSKEVIGQPKLSVADESLTVMNDRGDTFEQIAQVIEEQL